MQKVVYISLLVSCIAFQTVTKTAEGDANEAYLFGLFDSNTLPNPDTLDQCADDAIHEQIFNFVGPFLSQLNQAGITDIQQLINILTTFIDSLPQTFKDCVTTNPEFAAIGKVYGLDESTDFEDVKSKVIQYATAHLLIVKEWIKTAEYEWSQKQYENLGRESAYCAHLILTVSNESFLQVQI